MWPFTATHLKLLLAALLAAFAIWDFMAHAKHHVS